VDVPTPLESVQWIHGAANCATSTEPLIQVHQFDKNTFIMRLSKCFSYEGNFIYLLLGSHRAILLDTGGPPATAGMILPIRNTVDTIVQRWRQDRNDGDVDLIVAHTHSHQDHTFWDSQFEGRARTTIVKPALAAVKSFFGLVQWPEGEAALDLGERTITVFPLPGHETSHIAIYDGRTRALLTGDALYPGLLTVQDWPAYRRSAARLASFAEQHEVSLVLGNHIEMKNTPRELYTIGTTFQPHERPLPLTMAHVREWHAACEAMGNSPHRDVHDDFIIDAP
jgi:hydroxyacylglutathione hydrolase